jgi:hypothetical protein
VLFRRRFFGIPFLCVFTFPLRNALPGYAKKNAIKEIEPPPPPNRGEKN